MSRLIKIIGPFCKRAPYKRLDSPIETCNFKEPTNRSHPISPVIYRRTTPNGLPKKKSGGENDKERQRGLWAWHDV